MRRKKPEDQMMEEAIEKASQLINLLQKENTDLKRKADKFQKQTEALKKENRQLRQQNEIHSRQYNINSKIQSNKTIQLKKLQQSLNQKEDQLKKRTHNNKELHQKMSVLIAKLKQKSKEVNEEKTKFLSIQNQNQYLLKKIRKEEEKENQTNNKLKEIIQLKQIQIKELTKLKEAFSRRCQEFKADNVSLIEAAASYKQKAIDSVPEPTLQNTKHNLIKHVRTFSQRPSLQGQQTLARFIQQKLGVKPQSILQKQLQQLSNFISYRFDHIQKLWEGIHAKMQQKQCTKIRNLKELLTASQRISTYLSELISSKQ